MAAPTAEPMVARMAGQTVAQTADARR
jgi:hypothetical protein